MHRYVDTTYFNFKSRLPYGTGIYVEEHYRTRVKAYSRVNDVPYRTVCTVPYGRSRNKQTETVLFHILQKHNENNSYEKGRESESEGERERERKR